MTENGIQSTMPLGPANYGGDGMFGGNGAWWIVLFLIFGGWGWGGRGMGMNGGVGSEVELVRVLFSGLTKMKGYEGMLEYEEYEDGMSEARGRAANGRYMSYSDGYSQGYAEAMNEIGHSGHYPMYPRRY